jgi:nucleoside-diphosphate-sugar epimerase
VNDTEPVSLWPWLNELLAGVGLPGATRRVSEASARRLGAVAEGVWRLLRLPGEPPITRFVAAQLARSHWYDPRPARDAFGFEAPVGRDEALARTIAWWRPRLATEVGE